MTEAETGGARRFSDLFFALERQLRIIWDGAIGGKGFDGNSKKGIRRIKYDRLEVDYLAYTCNFRLFFRPAE